MELALLTPREDPSEKYTLYETSHKIYQNEPNLKVLYE